MSGSHTVASKPERYQMSI